MSRSMLVSMHRAVVPCCLALVFAVSLAPACGGGDDERTPSGLGGDDIMQPPGTGGVSSDVVWIADDACDVPGDIADCVFYHDERDGIQSCFEGKKVCGDDLVWSQCVATQDAEGNLVPTTPDFGS